MNSVRVNKQQFDNLLGKLLKAQPLEREDAKTGEAKQEAQVIPPPNPRDQQ